MGSTRGKPVSTFQIPAVLSSEAVATVTAIRGEIGVPDHILVLHGPADRPAGLYVPDTRGAVGRGSDEHAFRQD